MAKNQFNKSNAEASCSPDNTSDTRGSAPVAPTAEKTSRRTGRSRKTAVKPQSTIERLTLDFLRHESTAPVAESYTSLFECINADPCLPWNKPDRTIIAPSNDSVKYAIVKGDMEDRFLIDGNGGEEFRACWKITRDKAAVDNADRLVFVFMVCDTYAQTDVTDVTTDFTARFDTDNTMPGLIVRDDTGRVLLQSFRIGPDDYAATVEPVAIGMADLIAANATATIAGKEAVTT